MPYADSYRYKTEQELYDDIVGFLAHAGIHQEGWRLEVTTTYTQKKGMGWLPDLPDKRDHFYHLTPPSAALPSVVDLRPQMPPVYDQGQVGSCTGFATGGLLEYLHSKEGLGDRHFSELFIYYHARQIEHTTSQDAGAFLRDDIKGVVKYGACDESQWPYIESKVTTRPSPAATRAGKLDKVITYARVSQDKNTMHTALANQEPFIIGFTVYDSFMSQQVADTGLVPMPDFSKERVAGGHAVLVVGYDDGQDRYIVRNSWSDAWGQKGYFTIPQAYFEDNNLADDLWVVTFMK